MQTNGSDAISPDLMSPEVFAAARALAAHHGSDDVEAFRLPAAAAVAAVQPILGATVTAGPPPRPTFDPDSYADLGIPPAREWRHSRMRAALTVLADCAAVWSVEWSEEMAAFSFFNGIDYYNVYLCDCDQCNDENPQVIRNGQPAYGSVVLWDGHVGCGATTPPATPGLEGAAPTDPA